MTYEELKTLIAPDERRTLEIKKTTDELEDGMHSACAFLNTEGGWLIFGVASKSLKILGQLVTDNTKREIAQVLSHLAPKLAVHVEYIEIPDSEDKVIAMHFDGWVWGKSPYTYHGCPYYKVESTTQEMPREMFEERLNAAKPYLFALENKMADDFTIADFNEEYIMNAVRMGVRGGRLLEGALSLPTEEILSRFSLLKDGCPLLAAVVLFAKTPKFCSQLKLQMARFKGTDKMEFIDNKQVEGNFFELLDAGVAFCFKHLNLHGKVVGLQREEHLDIPYEAPREALINALCHRGYDSISISVSLAIYDDRMEIGNPGRFLVGITPDTIKCEGVRFFANPELEDRTIIEKEEMCRKTIGMLELLNELGFFTDDKDGKISKKEVMIAVGKAVNVDLTDYQNDLSRSLSDSTKLEKHLTIFDRLKDKMVEVFNNYGGQ